MRVLLVGATGNLGRHVIPALVVHQHIVTVYIRSPAKLKDLISDSLLARITVIIGDATDAESIKTAILQHGCDAVINVAGNIVAPWKEPVQPRIVRAVTDAAVAVCVERGGVPMRAWIIGGIFSMEYPGTKYQMKDYLPHFLVAHNTGSYAVTTSIPISSLRWSLLCVAGMRPVSNNIDILDTPHTHRLILNAGSPPGWQDSWVRKIPVVGEYLNIVAMIFSYTTKMEDVADFLAEDLERGSVEWVGKAVSMKERPTGS